MPSPTAPQPQPKSALRRAAGQPVSMAAGFAKGFGYSVLGFKLAFSKGLRRWTLAPVVINVVLYAVAAWGFVWAVRRVVHGTVGEVDRWYDYAFVVFVGVAALVLFALLFLFTFVLVVNVLAAPFTDVLSEKTEAFLTGHKLDEPFGLARLVRDMLVGIAHAIKLLLCQCVVLVVGFIPIIGPPVAVVGTAILLALEYMDCCMTRRRMAFRDKRRMALRSVCKSTGFGVGALLWMVVPVLNLVCVPAAVCGGTALFLDLEREDGMGRAQG